jgi:hypothetical protein
MGEFFRANMADEADKGNEQAGKISQIELAYRKPVPRELPKTGWCWNGCGTETEGLWCCGECKEDFETRKRLQARGKR